jgi:hypothetical protein
MSDPVAWHRETITPVAEDLLQGLVGLLPSGTYLAGGTALALRYGHRRSVDFDFFVPSEFSEDLLLQTLQTLPEIAAVERAQQTLHLTIQQVKVSFLGYSYPVLFPSEAFLGVPVADARDIACMKVTAIASRGTKRDFVDFFAACQRHGIAELLALFDRKYATTGYNRTHVLKSLTYFADAEKDPMPHMLVPLDWNEVKQYFVREAPRLR